MLHRHGPRAVLSLEQGLTFLLAIRSVRVLSVSRSCRAVGPIIFLLNVYERRCDACDVAYDAIVLLSTRAWLMSYEDDRRCINGLNFMDMTHSDSEYSSAAM